MSNQPDKNMNPEKAVEVPKHTPLPLSFDLAYEGIYIHPDNYKFEGVPIHATDADGVRNTIAIIPYTPTPKDAYISYVARANFIVTACNNHYDLLAALKKMTQLYVNTGNSTRSIRDQDWELRVETQEARAAIAAAEKGVE
jgi:hypothetical protein